MENLHKMAFIYFFFNKFEKVEKTGIIATKFSLRCTPFVILGYQYFLYRFLNQYSFFTDFNTSIFHRSLFILNS